MKPGLGKVLSIATIFCLLALGIVPAQADCTIACCGQAGSLGLSAGPGFSGQPVLPACSPSSDNSTCNLLSDLTLQVQQSAVLSMARGKTSTGPNLATAAAANFFDSNSPNHFISPPGLATTALNVPLYLRNLSLLI